MKGNRPSHEAQPDLDVLRAGLEATDDTEPLGNESRPAVPHISIAGYQLIRELHCGGQGIVFEAIQQSTKRKVAIKILSAGRYAPSSAKKRFKREVELVAQLKHPNIISIFDSGVTPDGLAFYVMEYIRGLRLGQYVREKQLTLEAMLGLFSTICGAVQYAHRRGVIHRDLKPSNILVDVDGIPKILDFGLAKLLVGPADATVSVTHTVLGTLPYMSPEQTRGNADEIDTRVDVYALGVILYELLTGHFPYPVVGEVAHVLQHVAETPPTPPTRNWSRDAGIPRRALNDPSLGECPIDREVETIVLKALAKERERRYQSAGELAEDIDRYLRGEPIEARRDSMTYVLQKRCRLLAQRHRVTTFLLAVAFGTLFASAIGVPLVFRWTPANMYFEQVVTERVAPHHASSALEFVRIITFNDETPLEDIARREGLTGVDVSNVYSLRRIHGKFMEKLAASGCRLVMWPVTFKNPTKFDIQFVSGVRTLQAAGAEVVVTVPNGKLDEKGFPILSKTITSSHVKWGTPIIGGEPPTVAFGAKSGPLGAQSALTVTACAAYRHPGSLFDIRLDRPRNVLDLQFYTTDETRTSAARRVASEGIPLAALNGGIALAKERFDKAGRARFSLNAQDLLGFYEFQVPPEREINVATRPYEEVFSADEQELRSWFEGKAVVVGDARGNARKIWIPDGRELVPVFLQASALEALLQHVFVRVPRLTGEWLLPFFSAALGCLVGGIGHGRAVRRWLAALALTVAWIVASMLVYRTTQYLFNPLVPVIALLAAVKLGAIIHRVGLR